MRKSDMGIVTRRLETNMSKVNAINEYCETVCSKKRACVYKCKQFGGSTKVEIKVFRVANREGKKKVVKRKLVRDGS